MALLNVSEVVAAHARIRPNSLGTRDSRRSLTFAEWDARASQLAQALVALGLAKGDRVGVLAYNCVEWMEIYVGLARAGLVAVPINFRLVGPEIQYIAEHCEAHAFIVQDSLVDRVEPLRAQLPLMEGRFIHFGADALPHGWFGYEDIVGRAPATSPDVDVQPEDPWALMYTSGTTGRPKGAIRNHAGSALIALVTALDMGLGVEDKALLVMPMCHANSLYFSFTFTYLGAPCVIEDRKSFDPEALLATFAREGITFTSLVPTHYVTILSLPEEVKARYDVSRVRKLMISSAPARRETKLAAMAYFHNSQLYELYGSTEAGWVTLLRPEEQLTKLGSVGREWTGSGAVKLLDPQGNEVPDGEVGELFSRTPYVFDGYWKDPQKTAEAFRGAWCSVGDMAYRDADGYIHLVDRKSNMIISGGENIYPSEVEGVIAAHPAVREVAIIGVPDEKWGETVWAVVALRDGQAVSAGEILDWCRERLAGYKRPKRVVFMADADMPRTATGKVQHRLLRQQLLQAEGVAG
jgi:acyl-CoA synthetase (AMP-forming)/AMP-acid ligase II